MRNFICVFSLFAAFLAAAQQPKPPLAGKSEELFNKGMNLLTGTGASRSDVDAAHYLRNSAELGYAPAQDVLAYLLETGQTVPANPREAADWYRQAANQGDRLAQWSVGRLYFVGIGVQRDPDLAETWLKKAARQDDPFAEYLLGRVRQQRADLPPAADWFHKAAEQGLPQAQKRYGLALKNGRGVNVDKVQAYIWLLLAFEAGDHSVAADISGLEAELGTAQVEQAKTHARDLESTASREVNAHGCTGWPGEFDDIPAPPPPKIQKFCR